VLSTLGASLKVTDAGGIPYDDYYFTPEYSYLRLESFDLFGFAALELLGEVLQKPAFTPDQFTQARDAAVARAEQDAATPRLVAGALQAGAPDRGGSVYGAAEELRRVDLDSIRRLHRSLTNPRNVVVTISSNLPADAMIGAARRVFGTMRGDDDPLAPAPRPPAAAGGLRSEAKTGRDQSWILVGRPVDVARGDEPALRLATAVLSERLAEQLRERDGLAYSIGASVRIESPGASVAMEAGTRAQNLEAMERGMLEVAASLRSNPPTMDEVEGARNRSEGRDRMRRLSRMGIAYALAMAELRGRDPLALDADLPALRAVTPDDVLRAASRYLAFETPWVSIAR
jgi:predicted Zn-dependent peptidase